jgi:hypothetical protein
VGRAIYSKASLCTSAHSSQRSWIVVVSTALEARDAQKFVLDFENATSRKARIK